MKLKVLRCPNCGASLKMEEDIDTFFCKYCGHRIVLEGQSKAAYNAKVRIKEMEHEEKIQDKHNEQERLRMEFEQKKERHGNAIALGILGVWIFIMIAGTVIGEAGVKKQEKELQATVDSIMVDIENEDFAEAYVKANTLYWDNEWTSREKDKWNATRKEVIRQIKEAEKKAKNSADKTKGDEGNSESGKPFWKFWE